MLFNSLDFAIFLPIVFVFYWFLFGNNIKAQNLIIAIASYVFYGWWDWRFLLLILFSTIVDYIVGLEIEKSSTSSHKKSFLYLSLLVNLGLLGFFKYYNFFIESFVDAFTLAGIPVNFHSLKIILPVGISFYTFQTMSYSIDIYRGKLAPTKDFIAFTAFVSFFPQLVAGPIERATNLLPQFFKKRRFNYQSAVDGLRQVLWGLTKKIIIADGCAEYANVIFNNSNNYGGSTLLVGAVFFAFQIYCDFSGYSDIAIGTSRLFGFELMQNFAFPYFSRDVAEFWRRWHISLSTWFRDYVYIPLGGSKGNIWMKLRNTFIIFIVSGFWHGANWTFIVWGALNALYYVPLLLGNHARNHIEMVGKNKFLPNLKELVQIMSTFGLICISWIFFRANNVSHALRYLREIASNSLFSFPEILPKTLILLLISFIMVEWLGRRGRYALENIELYLAVPLRWFIYILLITLMCVFGGKQQEFIYFQF